MARQVLPIVGAAVGAYFGGPQGAQIGFAIGSVIGNAVDPIRVEGNKVGDNPLQTAAEGGARAIVYGRGCVRATCILERGNRRIRKQRDQAGKGGGPVTVNERVYWTFAIGLGEDLVGGNILRIWEGEKLVYDVTPESTLVEESAQFSQKFRFYDGSEEQLPDPALEAIHGIGNTPYYRGTAYIVFPDFDLTDYRESIPTYRFEVARSVGYGDCAIYIAMDRSGSMTELTSNGLSRWENARTAVVGFLEFVEANVIHSSQVDVCVVLWGGLGSNEFYRQTMTRRSVATSDIADLIDFIPESIDNMVATSFRAAVADAPEFFDESPAELRRISIFITDGEPTYWNGSNWVPGSIAIEHATEAGETLLGISGIYAYAFNIDLLHTIETEKMDNTHLDEVPIIDGADPEALLAALSRTISAFTAQLGNTVGTLHLRAGHAQSDFDVSELTDEIDGVVFEQSITYSEAINQLIGPYMADPSDYDKQIHYIKRGKPVVRTLTFDDLVDEPETSMRENAIEYPRKLHLFFQSPLTAYASTKATSSRSSPDVRVIGETSVAIPITFTDPDKPARISAMLHKVYWQDAEGEIEWHVTDEQIDLVPGDCVGLSLRGVVRRARITRIEDDPGQRKLVMRSDRQSAYTSNVTGIPLPPPTPPQPSIISPTVEAILDIPALTDSADDLHYLAAMSGATDVWSGATLQRSLDDGANYTTVGQVSLNAIMGSLQDTVTQADPAYTDTTNVVRVQLYTDDELNSLSNDQFLSEQGAFVLSWDDSGGRRWEVMQARDVVDLGDGLFELSHLLRGCLNTDAAEHLSGALFVWLDASILKVAAQTAWLGADLTHRAVSNGLSPETADSDTLTYTGQSQTEWPVAYIQSLGVVADALAVTIFPRHRFGTDINPIRSINWSGYRITATDGSNSETVETTSDAHSFDVTGWSTPIDVTVAQLNRLTGAGPSVTEQFT